jgi:hypothetical protein
VDDAETELVMRRNEYSEVCRASVRAAATFHGEFHNENLIERCRGRTDHDERIQTARDPTGAASLQRDAGIADEQVRGSGDDLLPPASEKHKATQQARCCCT